MTTVGALCLMASRMTEEKFAERLIAERLTDVEQIRLWRKEMRQRSMSRDTGPVISHPQPLGCGAAK